MVPLTIAPKPVLKETATGAIELELPPKMQQLQMYLLRKRRYIMLLPTGPEKRVNPFLNLLRKHVFGVHVAVVWQDLMKQIVLTYMLLART